MPAHRNAPQTLLLDQMNQDLLSGNIVVSDDSHLFFDKITRHFPLEGSKIAWARTLGHIGQMIDYDNYENSVTRFSNLFVSAAELTNNDIVVVVGDSALDVSLTMPIDLLCKYLINIVGLPQHTYLMSRDAYWCACYTLEGSMDFGFSPSLAMIL